MKKAFNSKTRFLIITMSLISSTFIITACSDDDDTTSSSETETISKKEIALSYGVRPAYLIDDMDEGPLKDELLRCQGQIPKKSSFSIAHRGAPMQFPEHTHDSYMAAARQGVGVMECDVAFTKDKNLVCRHAQNDLHTTTNIVSTDLANQCTVAPIVDEAGQLTNAKDIECRTSDITLAEFKTLKGKMDAANKNASNIADYMNATAKWRTDLYSQNGEVLTLAEHIALTESLDIKHTPELKNPIENMPFNGYTLDEYRQQMIDTYKNANVSADNFYPQSFDYDTILFWLKNNPEYAKNAVYLIEDATITAEGQTFDKNDSTTWNRQPTQIKADGIKIVAPATWMLVTTDGNGKMMPSEYAKALKAANLDIITWTIERSGPLAEGGGWYYTNLKDAINNDGDMMNYIDVLAQDVGVIGIFSDWPATVTYYANCKGL